MGKVPAKFLTLSFLLAIFACAHPISQGMRETLDPGVSLPSLFTSPDVYIGKKVMLGGVIVETRNLPEKSEIELVQKEIDSSGRVSGKDTTLGRFIFRKQGYLESEIYTKGRKLIGAGQVVGSQPGKIGDRDYLFPVVEAEELHLEKDYQQTPYYNDPFYPYYYQPFYFPSNRYYYYHPYYY
jgi:outer membrane lipoprotein